MKGKSILAGFCLLAVIVGSCMLIGAWWSEQADVARMAGATLIAGMGVAMLVPALSDYRFTLGVLIANAAALLAPTWFRSIGGFSLSNPWVMLIVIQGIMFGMGTQMSLPDFFNIARMPVGVLVGLLCQFFIMPLLGMSLAKLFRFPPEVAAGMILVGSCSSGLASNVMTYLAKGNLALSVTMTALATALAPIMTPLWMKLLAGSLIDVDPTKMSLDIFKMVLVPILAAFVNDGLLSTNPKRRRLVLVASAISFLWLVILGCGGWHQLADSGLATGLMALPGYIAGALVFGTAYHFAVSWVPRIADWMPTMSMCGIVYFTLVTTAKGRDQLLEVGLMLVLAVALHNLGGYLLGYWGSRLLRLNQRDARTIAIEVGIQNGSMATGLAIEMGKLETVGLAAMIFAPLMNVTGSILANYWKRTAKETFPIGVTRT
jgi:BASS family bile acid:Na+ symporter